MPQQVFLLIAELEIRLVDREAGQCSNVDKFALPFAHFLTAPAENGAIVYRQ